jgi:tetratricopeptide (TPR) repeat protein
MPMTVPGSRDDDITRVSGSPGTGLNMDSNTRIGPWRILRRIGSGGMGDVFLAERADGAFQQQVALKLLLNRGSVDALSRFAIERQALARLEHPNIARLIDGGEGPDGRPYLAMEFVDGVPLDEYLADRPIDQILDVMRQVCDAVAYAHRQLILHRDLKPGNILVDKDGRPRLLDFGIAKLLESPQAIEGTIHREIVYTPQYASPEQVFDEAIGVPSDVYSLGVILYRLLSGMKPYEVETGVTAHKLMTLMESLKVTPPSRAVAGNTHLGANERRHRARRLTGDLDTVVLTAMHRDPARRYGSVDALSDDLARVVQHLPIRARPDSMAYRARLFVRRNRVAVIAGVLLFLALLGGLMSSLWQANIAREQRSRAEARFNDVRELARSLLFDIHDAIAKLPGSTAARSVLVQKAQAYLERLDQEGEAPLALKREIAEAWLRIGDVQGKPGQANLGETVAALQSYDRADAALAPVLMASPDNEKALLTRAHIANSRAATTFFGSDMQRADQEYQRAQAILEPLATRGVRGATQALLVTLTGLGDVAYWTDQYSTAIAHYRAAIALFPKLDDVPQRVRDLNRANLETRLGDVMAWNGDLKASRNVFKKVLDELGALRESAPHDGQVLGALALVWIKLGDSFEEDSPAQQLDAYQHALPIYQELADLDHADVSAQRSLALNLSKLGNALTANQRYVEAGEKLDAALASMRTISANDPANLEYLRSVGNMLYYQALLQIQQGHPDSAVPLVEEMLANRRKASATAPDSSMYQRDVAIALGLLVDLQPKAASHCARNAEANALWLAIKANGAAFPSDADEMTKVAKRAAACATAP